MESGKGSVCTNRKARKKEEGKSNMATTPTPPMAADQAKELVKGAGSRSVKDLLLSEDFRAQVAMALPRHLKPERFIRVALNATLRQPELLQCQRESLFLALLQLSAYGIEADGRRAHLIPFWDHKVCVCGHEMEMHRQGHCSKCNCTVAKKRRLVQLIIDYKGLAELIRRSGEVSYIHADMVLDGDDWDFQFGSAAFLRHKPNLALGTNKERKIVAFYSFVKLKDGSEDFIVLSKADVDAVRSRSKSKDSGPWVTDFGEMGKKSAFRRHSKWLPLSPELRDVVETDDEGEDFSLNAGVVLDGMSTVVADEAPDDPAEDNLSDRIAKAAASVIEKQKQETKPETGKPESHGESKLGPVAVDSRPVDPATLKVYAKDALPDAMDMKAGTHCIYEGQILKVTDEGGDVQSWVTVGPAPAAKGTRGRPRNAGAFDAGGEGQ